MGDTGSLALGGAISAIAILAKFAIDNSYSRWHIFCRSLISNNTSGIF